MPRPKKSTAKKKPATKAKASGRKKTASTKKKTTTKKKVSGAKDMHSERRRAYRAKAGTWKVKVDCRDVDVFVSSKIMNISRTGLLLKTRNPPPRNTPLDIEFALSAGQEPVHASGKVVWIGPQASQGNATMPVGVGIRFENLDRKDLKKIEDFIEKSQKSDKF